VKERKNITDEVEDQMRRQKSNRNTTQILMTAFTLVTLMFTLKTSDCHLQAHNTIWLTGLKPLWFQVETAPSCGATDYLGGLFHYRKIVNRVTELDETMPAIHQKAEGN